MKSQLSLIYRVICGVLLITTLLFLTGCADDSLEDQLEHAEEASRQSYESYKRAIKDYYDLLDGLEAYEKAQNYLNSFK